MHLRERTYHDRAQRIALSKVRRTLEGKVPDLWGKPEKVVRRDLKRLATHLFNDQSDKEKLARITTVDYRDMIRKEFYRRTGNKLQLG